VSDSRLMVGLGNELRGDDAAGLLLARAVRERAPDGIDVVELGGEPLDLIEAWEGAGTALVADAVCSGGEPGELRVIDAAAGPLPAAFGSASTHALGLAEAVELGRALGRLPSRLLVLGIEAADFEPGAAPSVAVLAAIEPAAECVLRWLRGSTRPEETRRCA
jgi:hydrogenase maturation protease